MIFERLLAQVCGYYIVALMNNEGKVLRRWAKRTPFGFSCQLTNEWNEILLCWDGTIYRGNFWTIWKPWYPADVAKMKEQ
jgi:hypothetical protein